MTPKTDSLIEAVRFEDADQVEALIRSGAPLEEKDKKGQTPLILAAKTDQYEIAEQLLGAGANVFAVSDFGWTAGYAAQTSNLAGGPEFDALQRFKVQLEQRGYPVPGPDKPDIKRMAEEGNWPPREWRH